MKTRIQVISQGGRLVGVYVPPVNPPSDPNAPTAYLRAGPRQKISEIEVEIAQAVKTPKEIHAFHAQVRKRLKLRK